MIVEFHSAEHLALLHNACEVKVHRSLEGLHAGRMAADALVSEGVGREGSLTKQNAFEAMVQRLAQSWTQEPSVESNVREQEEDGEAAVRARLKAVLRA